MFGYYDFFLNMNGLRKGVWDETQKHDTGKNHCMCWCRANWLYCKKLSINCRETEYKTFPSVYNEGVLDYF